MRYLVVREDEVSQELRDKKIKRSEFFTKEEIVTMNALSRVEVIKGNVDLNAKMMFITDYHSQQELVARIMRESKGKQ